MESEREGLSEEKLGYYKPIRTFGTSQVMQFKLTKVVIVVITVFTTRKKKTQIM